MSASKTYVAVITERASPSVSSSPYGSGSGSSTGAQARRQAQETVGPVTSLMLLTCGAKSMDDLSQAGLPEAMSSPNVMTSALKRKADDAGLDRLVSSSDSKRSRSAQSWMSKTSSSDSDTDTDADTSERLEETAEQRSDRIAAFFYGHVSIQPENQKSGHPCLLRLARVARRNHLKLHAGCIECVDQVIAFDTATYCTEPNLPFLDDLEARAFLAAMMLGHTQCMSKIAALWEEQGSPVFGIPTKILAEASGAILNHPVFGLKIKRWIIKNSNRSTSDQVSWAGILFESIRGDYQHTDPCQFCKRQFKWSKCSAPTCVQCLRVERMLCQKCNENQCHPHSFKVGTDKPFDSPSLICMQCANAQQPPLVFTSPLARVPKRPPPITIPDTEMPIKVSPVTLELCMKAAVIADSHR